MGGIDVLLKAAHIYEKEMESKVVTIIAGNGELFGELSQLKKD